jgi:hypothetical protein
MGDRALRNLVLALVFSLVAAGARAEPSPADRALAEQLFRDGRALVEQGRIAAGCRKLAESQRLDPAGGTLMNLARCHKQEGKTASAWAEYSEARDQAAREGRSARVEEATLQLRELEPRLSRLTVALSLEVTRLPGLVVLRNGRRLSLAALDAMIVDPGSYRIDVRALGKRPHAVKVVVGPNGDSRTVVVRALSDAPPPSHTEDAAMHPQRMAGAVIGAFGLAGLACGVVAGIVALAKQSEADDTCPETTCSDAGAVSLNYQARRSALVADVALPSGAALTILGAVLFFTAPTEESEARVGIAPAQLPGGAGLRLVVTQ